MQQKLNPQQKDSSTGTIKIKNVKILKSKGKPFWLCISHKKNNYKPYISQLNSNQSRHVYSKSLLHNKQMFKQKCSPSNSSQSYRESIISDNQIYESDFQSYQQQCLKNTKKLKFIMPKLKPKPKLNNLKKKINLSLEEINLTHSKRFNCLDLKTAKKKGNHYYNKSICKTQQSSQIIRQYTLNIERQILMVQSEIYLKRQNQKLIRRIQQLRCGLPFLLQNIKQLRQQNAQLSQIKKVKRKAISLNYQSFIEQKKSFTVHKKSQVQNKLKKISSQRNSSKPHIKSYFSQDIPIRSTLQIVRQKFVFCAKTYILREQRSIKLNEKLHFYEEILSKLESNLSLGQIQNLQRRRIFLQWEINKKSFDFDIKIIQEELINTEIQNEIYSIDSLTHRIQMQNKKIVSEIKQKQKIVQLKKQPIKKFPQKQRQSKLKLHEKSNLRQTNKAISQFDKQTTSQIGSKSNLKRSINLSELSKNIKQRKLRQSNFKIKKGSQFSQNLQQDLEQVAI